MNTASKNNANRSAGPSAKADRTAETMYGPTFTEEQYLSQQAALAKRSMGQSVARLRHHLGQGVKPKAWFKAHPVASTSVAVVTGIAAARLLFGRKHVHHYNPSTEGFTTPPNYATAPAPGTSFTSRIITDLIRIGLPALISTLAAAKTPEPEPAPTTPAPDPNTAASPSVPSDAAL